MDFKDLEGRTVKISAHTITAKDFCAPEFDKQHREMQLEKVRQLMTPIFENEV